MIINSITFLSHTLLAGIATLIAFYLGKEALIASICVQSILANLCVLKTINLGNLTATAGDGYIVGIIFGMHLLQEYYGKHIARKAITTSMFTLIVYTLMTSIHLAYIPTAHDTFHDHYSLLFGLMPRIALASLTAYGTSQWFDTIIFGWLKKLCGGNLFTIRNYLCAALSQLVDTMIFTFIGLYGITSHIGTVAITGYLIKMGALLCVTPCIMITKKWWPYVPHHKKSPTL